MVELPRCALAISMRPSRGSMRRGGSTRGAKARFASRRISTLPTRKSSERLQFSVAPERRNGRRRTPEWRQDVVVKTRKQILPCAQDDNGAGGERRAAICRAEPQAKGMYQG